MSINEPSSADHNKRVQAVRSVMREYEALLSAYGDVQLGIVGTLNGGPGLIYQAPDDIPRLRITRRSNVVVEIGGAVVATALHTWGMGGRKARAAIAEDFMQEMAGRR